MPLVLFIHYVVGICSIAFNVALMLIVSIRTPRQYRIDACLIFEECVFLLISSIANIVSMQRLIPIRDTTIFGSQGVCTRVSAHFCYFFHVLTVGAFACSFFIATYQLVLRQRLLKGDSFEHAIWWCFPTAIYVLGIHVSNLNAAFHQTATSELEKLVNATFPEFIEERVAINGHDSFTNSIPVILVNGFYVISLPFMWILVYFLRRSILILINSQTCKLSERSKRLQRQLVQPLMTGYIRIRVVTLTFSMVTVHALLSTTALWPSVIFFLGQFIAVHDVDFLDSCFFFIQLHCAVAPLVIVYHVSNYRRTVLLITGFSNTSKEEMPTVIDVTRRLNIAHNAFRNSPRDK